FTDRSGATEAYRTDNGVGAVAADTRLAGREIWRIDPSAAQFAALILDQALVKVAEDSTAYHITFDNREGSKPEELVKAALTLRKPDLHVTEELLQLKRDGSLVEYRFFEDTFEEVKPAALPPDVFNVEPALTPSESVLTKPGPGIKPESQAGT